MRNYKYIGTELDLFAAAMTWKAYFCRHLEPYIGQEVLEVGAGQGSTTRILCKGNEERWVCLEPDVALAEHLAELVHVGQLPTCCHPVSGMLGDMTRDALFDTIMYIDVLEHIKDDKWELTRAAEHLRLGGHLLVFGPAHQWLYTPFDKAIGHFRRYNKRSLRALAPSGLELVLLIYLDSIGLLASLGNLLLLRRTMPTTKQIAIWDKIFVRLSRVFDPLLLNTVGKSILAVWQRR